MIKYSMHSLARCQLWPLLLCLWAQQSLGLSFPWPAVGDVIGSLQYERSQGYEAISDVGQRYDIGVYEMLEANPNLNPWAPQPGSTVKIPSHFILPSGPREGLVINLAEMRLYYYHPDKKTITTFPVAIGKIGWPTPLGQTSIISKKASPTWHVPPAIRKGHHERGWQVPSAVPPGPTNPLGDYALYLGFSGYLIHGTIHPGGIGMRTTHGCIRLFPENIAWLFEHIPTGTPLRLVHESLKVGRGEDNQIYLEAHLPLREALYHPEKHTLKTVEENIKSRWGSQVPSIQWTLVQKKIQGSNGIPEAIGSLSQ